MLVSRVQGQIVLQDQRAPANIVRGNRRALFPELAEHGRVVVSGLVVGEETRTPSFNRKRRRIRSFSACRRPWAKPAEARRPRRRQQNASASSRSATARPRLCTNRRIDCIGATLTARDPRPPGPDRRAPPQPPSRPSMSWRCHRITPRRGCRQRRSPPPAHRRRLHSGCAGRTCARAERGSTASGCRGSYSACNHYRQCLHSWQADLWPGRSPGITQAPPPQVLSNLNISGPSPVSIRVTVKSGS